MQFVVPQFIDVEAKIIGPVSARQFIILMVTIGCIFLWFRLFTTVFAGIATFFTGTLGGMIAFGKVNGQAMHYFILNIIQTIRRPSLKVWKKLPYEPEQQAAVVSSGKDIEIKPVATRSRLAEMSLMVDTGGAYGGENMGLLQQQSSPATQITELRNTNRINLRK